MNERPPTQPVLPSLSSRAALPRLAVILVGGILLGFWLGLTAAPKAEPSAPPGPVSVAPAVTAGSPSIGSMQPSPTPSATVELPPADALALPAALTALDRTGMGGVSSAAVISARLTTVAGAEAASSSMAAPPDEWVWAFIVRGSFPAPSCGGYTASPHPCPPPATTMLVLLDARTGEFVLAVSPALPEQPPTSVVLTASSDP
jgi:hypothetical protein